MLIKPYLDQNPRIHPTVRIAETASVIGDVALGEHVSLWYGAILRGDAAPIAIGANTNIQDGCIVHADPGIPTKVGQNVTVGHGAILHGCTVGDDCLIGMGATLMNHCVIGEGSIVAAGALVTERTVIPPGSMVMGCPGKAVRTVRPGESEANRASAAHYVELAARQLPFAENFSCTRKSHE